MESTLSRRSFIVASGAAALAAAAVSGVAVNAQSAVADEAPSDVITPAGQADTSYEADVIVVGLGTSGLMAAHGAAVAGAKVIGVDTAADMTGVTNVNTASTFGVGTSIQKQYEEQLTIPQVMAYYNDGTNYQTNQQTLRAALGGTASAIDTLTDAGMTWTHSFDSTGDAATVANLGMHRYGLSGEDRAAVFTKIMEDDGVECVFGCTVQSALYNDDGTICGVQAVSADGSLVDFYGKSIVLATGGFLGNPDMIAEYLGGIEVVCGGNAVNKGVGLKLALEAGAQMGKCYTISINEYGGANSKATVPVAWLPNGANDALRMPLFGGLLVDAEGGRFVDEGLVCENTSMAAEPLLHVGYHYAIVDDDFMNRLATEPIADFYGTARMKGSFADITVSDIFEQFDEGIEEGWAFKADTIAEIAEHFGMSHLVETVETYNDYCENGEDEEFYKDPKYLTPILQAPFYAVQSMPSGWVTMGGIKTDAWGHALDAQYHIIPGLYVTGASVDMFTAPYYMTGSCNGFCLGYGYVTGETAAYDAQA